MREREREREREADKTMVSALARDQEVRSSNPNRFEFLKKSNQGSRIGPASNEYQSNLESKGGLCVCDANHITVGG
jgi:hypothetical protein